MLLHAPKRYEELTTYIRDLEKSRHRFATSRKLDQQGRRVAIKLQGRRDERGSNKQTVDRKIDALTTRLAELSFLVNKTASQDARAVPRKVDMAPAAIYSAQAIPYGQQVRPDVPSCDYLQKI